jgi:hypothetical protein
VYCGWALSKAYRQLFDNLVNERPVLKESLLNIFYAHTIKRSAKIKRSKPPNTVNPLAFALILAKIKSRPVHIQT